MTEDEMVGWHHRLNGHEFKQAPGDGKGQGSLMCYSPWGRKELDTAETVQQDTLKMKSVLGQDLTTIVYNTVQCKILMKSVMKLQMKLLILPNPTYSKKTT